METKHLESENEQLRKEYNILHGGNSNIISKPVWDSSDKCDTSDEIQKALVELQQQMKEGEDKGRVLDLALHLLLSNQERIEAEERDTFTQIFMKMKYTVLQV